MTVVRHLLVVGGARSGKSAFAQAQVERSGLAPIFVATAQAFDSEMHRKIAQHVADRDARWQTIEAPFDLAAALDQESDPERLLLVDCLTLWLSNLLLRGDDVEFASQALVAAIGRASGPLVIVSNEVGGGIVPDNALARRFRDAQGRLNQMIARACDGVVLVSAGLPVVLKPAPTVEIAFRP